VYLRNVGKLSPLSLPFTIMKWYTLKKHCVCKKCGKALSSRTSLAFHERIHSGKKPYVCQHCGTAFIHSSWHHQHERITLGRNPIHVRNVGKPSPLSLPFTVMKWSTLKKSCVCKKCGKAFTSLPSLHCHEMVHTEEILCV
jgi:KRAB domain-containing zinc finger protein